MSANDDHRPDDDLDPDERLLAARLTSTLAGQAGTVVLADEAFDPTRPATSDLVRTDDEPRRAASLPVARSTGRGPAATETETETDAAVLEPLPMAADGSSGRGWLVWAAGAVAAAVLVAAIVMINAVQQPSVTVVDDPALVGPDGLWAPTWVPDGFELWDQETWVGDPYATVRGPSQDAEAAGVPKVQLLESSTDGARMLLSIGQALSSGPSPGTPITIRGTDGMAVEDATLDAETANGYRLEWSDGGTAFGAFVAGTELDVAVSVIDGLSFAVAGDPVGGFAPPADGSWTVRNDEVVVEPDDRAVATSFTFDRTRPTGTSHGLQVFIATGIPSLVGHAGYLTTAFAGSLRDDGVAVAFLPGDGDGDPASWTAWPDGRTIVSSGPDLDEATATRIANSVEPSTRAELAALGEEATERLAAGEVLAAADLPSGRVEVIGPPDASALCVTTSGRRTCKSPARLSRDDFPPVASVVVDGTWYVIGAAEDGSIEMGIDRSTEAVRTSGTAVATPVDPASGDGAAGDDGATDVDILTTTGTVAGGGTPVAPSELAPPPHEPAVPGTIAPGPDRSVAFESAVAGRWNLALLVVPAGVDRAWVAFPGRSMGIGRPSA